MIRECYTFSPKEHVLIQNRIDENKERSATSSLLSSGRSKVKRYSRIFWVDEDEQIHRLPTARYDQIYNRTKAMHLFAGKTIRFAHVVIELREDQQVKAISGSFPKYKFDASGYLDQEQKTKLLRDAGKMLEVVGQSEWEELYSLEYNEPHGWKPTNTILDQLNAAIQKATSR